MATDADSGARGRWAERIARRHLERHGAMPHAIVQAELDLLQLTTGREDLESVFLKLTEAREESP